MAIQSNVLQNNRACERLLKKLPRYKLVFDVLVISLAFLFLLSVVVNLA